MAEQALRFVQVAKRYGARSVIDGLDLDVQAGEFFGLVGVNGVGKTTLIRGLLDFCAIDAGVIEVFGIRHLRTEARRRLAFLPERFTPPYFLTGGDFLAYMASLHRRPHGRDGVGPLLRALDLDEAVLKRPVRELSKGMAQKLGLAGCLLSGKELLVLDEPMGGLDPKARALLKRHLLGLKAGGRTLFFSTHLLADVEALCDRMGILHGGRLRFVGTPQACRQAYAAETLEEAFLKCIDE